MASSSQSAKTDNGIFSTDYESISKEIVSFLKSNKSKQQKFFSLLYLYRSCLDYIQRFVQLINVTSLYPQVQIIDFDEKFNKEAYKLTLRSFLNILRKIFGKLTEMRKDKYAKYIHNEIINIKHIIKNWRNAELIIDTEEYKLIEEEEDKIEIKRQYTFPNTEFISQFINDRSPYLYLYRKIYNQIDDFLKSLKYNQQAQYSLLYLIHFVNKFLSQANLSINISIDYSYQINLYEEFYNEKLYSSNLQSFLNNLAQIYYQIINNPKADIIVSLMSLNSFIENEIQKVSNIIKHWSYLHIVFPCWNIKQLYE